VAGAELLGAGDLAPDAELREQPAGRLEVLGGPAGLALRVRELGQREWVRPGEARSDRLEGPQRLAQPALGLAVVAPGTGDVAQRALGQARRPT
jgi:hypothetical protein